MIKTYSFSSLGEDLKEHSIEVQDRLIERCMNILKESSDENQIKRVIEILKHVIYDAEKKGTGDV